MYKKWYKRQYKIWDLIPSTLVVLALGATWMLNWPTPQITTKYCWTDNHTI